MIKQFFQRMIGFLKQRIIISVLGLFMFGAIVWFGGPLISIGGSTPLGSVTARLVVIFVFVLIWLLYIIWKMARQKKQDQEIEQGLMQQPAPTNDKKSISDDEVSVLKERFSEGIAVLKKHSRKGGKSLVDLPLYIIIGPPGSGKTTSLASSGLNFPLAEETGQQSIRGIGGTRNCDWWFTDDAVLLDTAGRYVTQDSNSEADSAAWKGFLTLLKKHRRRRPVNGVMVSLSLADLMQSDEANLNRHVNSIRTRIKELYEHFGIRFPVYVLLTKCDLVAGFTEFFDDLGQEDREQVLGLTLPMEEGTETSPVEHFQKSFDQLMERLNSRMLNRLNQERSMHRRGLVFNFPNQMDTLRIRLEPFLRAVFAANKFQETAMLRGVYFTSGTQEGTPISRMMGSMARSMGLEQQETRSQDVPERSYFITNLFRRVIFPEASLVGSNAKVERRRAQLQKGSYIATAATIVLSIGFWIMSYGNNGDYVQQVGNEVLDLETQVDRLRPEQSKLTATLPMLNKARNLSSGYANLDHDVPFSRGLGLAQDTKLGEAASDAYVRLLKSAFLPRLSLQVEQILKTPSLRSDQQYEALKTYLTLNSDENYDGESLARFLEQSWKQGIPREYSREQQQILNQHVAALAANGPLKLNIEQDDKLIDNVRKVQQQVPLAERAFSRIQLTPEALALPEFNVEELIGADAQLIFSRDSGEPITKGIPGIFTRDGYHNYFKDAALPLLENLANEEWILGQKTNVDPDQLNAMVEQMEQLYFQEFTRQWRTYLNDLAIKKFSNLPQAVVALQLISESPSPIQKLVTAVKEQTLLDEEALSFKDNPDQFKLSQRLRPELAFASTYKLLEAPAEGEAAPIAAVLAQVGELHAYMNGMLIAADQGVAAMAVARETNAGSNIIARLKLQSANQPLPVSRLLGQLAGSSLNLVLFNVNSYLNNQWANDVRPFCEQGIDGRYPLDRTSERNITLVDFGRFFSPSGILSTFFDENLKDFVDTTKDPWRWRTIKGASSPLDAKSLRMFQNAEAIRTGFFSQGGESPAVRFTITPVVMDSTITRFLLNIEGQRVVYRNGPIRPNKLVWPGPDQDQEVRFDMAPTPAGKRSGRSTTGPWAWFRLLDKSNLRKTRRAESFAMTFRVGSRKAVFTMNASSIVNPFQLQALNEFSCLDRL
ncbi:type VI secretion system membrane subunit TssM [Pelagibaculum spongiae]|uniref:Type VI secretion system membrane subunit TssM n=1 Tax=Pelagibaculum spongiae TaxID=2080658 RepID=A0A2V1GTG6_9GAMM|nr:type VI secretion system membrane subunit TssM [Pelagibaculum spongiae]PVZ67676.1 type VI secretion system membrane subunit TssM [Pelagibaculum spongiae]